MVEIRPGKHFTLITNDEVTNEASPTASTVRTPKDAKKNTVPEGSKFKNLKK